MWANMSILKKAHQRKGFRVFDMRTVICVVRFFNGKA